MKNLLRSLEEYLGLIVILSAIIGFAVFLYKIAAGTYHLLDKLIDKL